MKHLYITQYTVDPTHVNKQMMSRLVGKCVDKAHLYCRYNEYILIRLLSACNCASVYRHQTLPVNIGSCACTMPESAYSSVLGLFSGAVTQAVGSKVALPIKIETRRDYVCIRVVVFISLFVITLLLRHDGPAHSLKYRHGATTWYQNWAFSTAMKGPCAVESTA